MGRKFIFVKKVTFVYQKLPKHGIINKGKNFFNIYFVTTFRMTSIKPPIYPSTKNKTKKLILTVLKKAPCTLGMIFHREILARLQSEYFHFI